jgi:hypothetical protein
MNFSLAVRSGRKVRLGWGSRIPVVDGVPPAVLRFYTVRSPRFGLILA